MGQEIGGRMSRFVILDAKPMPVAGLVPARAEPGHGRSSVPVPRGEPAGAAQPGLDLLALVDPHALRRASVQHLLQRCVEGLEVACFASAAELVGAAPADDCGLAMIVVSVGGTPLVGGGAASELQALCTRFAPVPVVVMSDREDSRDIVLACHLGARGYLPTTLEPNVAQEVLHLVRAGGTYVPLTGLLAAIDGRQVDAAPTRGPQGRVALTPRQYQVLQLLSLGKPNKVIANELGMEESTVKVHVRQAMH